MQAIPDTKKQEIFNQLFQIDCDLQSINIEENERQVRLLIDCRRQLLANLKSLKQVNGNTKRSPGYLEYQPTAVTTELVKQWCSRVTQAKPDHQSFRNPNFCDQILDSILPETWNFYSDVMVLCAPPSNSIVSKAVGRNQRHIVIFDYHKCINERALTQHSNAKIVVCSTFTDVEIAFAKLQTPAEQVITVPCSLDPKIFATSKSHLAEAIRKGKKNRIANTITANRFGVSWSRNLLKNLPLIAKAPGIHQLSVKGVKDAVIVASGPSLNKNVHILEDSRSNFYSCSFTFH